MDKKAERRRRRRRGRRNRKQLKLKIRAIKDSIDGLNKFLLTKFEFDPNIC